MNRIKLYFVLMSFVLPLVSPFAAFSQVQVSPLVFQIYSDHFLKYDTVNNMPWDCGGNSYDLFLELQKAGAVNPSQSFIVHAFYEKDFKLDANNKPLSRMLIPLKPRDGNERWAFHAVLVVQGNVFDQYFTNHPSVLDFATHAQEAWGTQNLQDLKFQVVPASKYHAVAMTGYSVPVNEYPIMSFDQVQKLLAP